jgi:hypothetical protein
MSMALADGDYLTVAEKVVATLLADNGEGGLREGNNPEVKTIEPRIRREARLYSKYELPLIGVEVKRKTEIPAPTSRLVEKVFELEFLVLCRGGDRELEIARAQKITARLEYVLRRQNLPDQQFAGLPGLIPGSEGVLLARLMETVFESRFLEEANARNPEVAATVSAEIILPSRAVL